MVTALVKICGLRTPADAIACREAGAALAGVNFVTGSRRAVTAPAARRVLRELSGCSILIYRDASLQTVQVETEALGVGWVQLHGDEPPADCARLRAQGLRVIKALSIGPDLVARARAYVRSVDALLIDAPRPGSGEPWDWAQLASLDLPRPWLLAGGLTPATVAAAVAAARPDGVDVASGVEVGGQMSAPLIAAFVREATLALARLGPRHPLPSTTDTP